MLRRRRTRVQAPPLFYIQNAGRPVGNSARWWCVDGCGYTSDLDKAWQVTNEKAESICHDRPGEDIAWPVSLMDAIAQRHVDVTMLYRLQSANAENPQTVESPQESANTK